MLAEDRRKTLGNSLLFHLNANSGRPRFHYLPEAIQPVRTNVVGKQEFDDLVATETINDRREPGTDGSGNARSDALDSRGATA